MFTQLLQLTGLVQKWPTLTREEVAKHNTCDSLWIVIDNSVYDITPIIDKHPGGRGALLKRGGGVKDCAEDMMFHSRVARRDAQQYKIGQLSLDDVPKPSAVPRPASPQQQPPASPLLLSKMVISTDMDDYQGYCSDSAYWDSAAQDQHPLSSSDTDIRLVAAEGTFQADLAN